MKPLGLRPNKFPNKIDNHPPRGWVNWWEHEINNKNGNKRSRREWKKNL